MKAVSDCALCLLKLAHTASDAAGAPEGKRLEAVRAALQVLAADDFSRIPPAIARDVLEGVGGALKNPDPFSEIKRRHNRRALELVSEWAFDFLKEARDPDERLSLAVRVSLAGNGMDLATIPEESEPDQFRKWVEVPWAINQFDDFNSELTEATDVLFLCDNAGEIAFDKVLLSCLLELGKDVTVCVKSGPALNDATLEDAREVGLDSLEADGKSVRLITTGQATMGVDLATASPEFRECFQRAGIVIGKGQANLESLHNCGRPVYFITLIKCGHVARYYEMAKGSAMLYRGGMENGVLTSSGH
ncbi:MAG: ARMT1-like domain-containing protein [bacterium]